MGSLRRGSLPGPSFPNASSTGPAAGTVFTNVPSGSMGGGGSGWTWNTGGEFVEANTASTVISNLNITAGVGADPAILVTADNVTISNCIITTSYSGGYGVQISNSGSTVIDSTSVINCLLAGSSPGADRMQTAVIDPYTIATNTLVQGCEIYWANGGLEARQGSFIGNYMHDFSVIAGDHNEGVHCDGPPSSPLDYLTIQGNTILLGTGGIGYPQTAAIICNQSYGVCSNITIDSNLVAGGNYPIEAGANANAARNISGSGANGDSGSSVTGGLSSQALVQVPSGLASGYDTAATITCPGHIPSGTFITGVYNGTTEVNATQTGNQYTLSCLPGAVTTGSSLTFNVNPITSNIVVTNNRISTMFYYPGGGANGLPIRFDATGSGNVWNNNVIHETNVVIPAP